MAAAESSSKLRELLKIRDEDDVRCSGPVGQCDKRGGGGSSGSGGGRRRLLDIMREQEANEDTVVVGNFGNGINWKSFVDRLRHRRAGNVCAAAAISSGQPNRVRYPEIIVSVRPNSASRSISGRGSAPTTPASIVNQYSHAATDASAAVGASSPPEVHPSGGLGSEAPTIAQGSSDIGRTAEAPASSTAAAAAAATEEGQQARVSLMALLEQTDRQWTSIGDGISPAALAALNALEQAAEDDAIGGGDSSRMLHVCCVCMVRERGAAFIPCGHTFCRRCSREVWVNRGSCPLCNAFILEILDIF